MDRGLTQHEVAKIMGVNRNFVYEIELNKRTYTIYALHKSYCFLGYIPTTLNIHENTLAGKMFVHRIVNGYSFEVVAKEIGIDKSTLGRFECGKNLDSISTLKIKTYLNNLCSIFNKNEAIATSIQIVEILIK